MFRIRIITMTVVVSIVTTLMCLSIVLTDNPISDLLLRNRIQSVLGQAQLAAADSGRLNSPVVKAVTIANPAVVSIIISKNVPIMERYYENVGPISGLFGGNFFVPRYRSGGVEEQEIGGGSGFIISSDGLVVTNSHVIDDPQASYTVLTNDGKRHETKVITKNDDLDVAVLEIEGSDFPYLEFADSNDIQVGQSVIAIGNALGEFSNTVSVGVVSGLARSIVAGDDIGRTELLQHVIQTDAAINPGNSGGPLLDLSGKVIGVNIAVVRQSENIGFALPSNVVKSVVLPYYQKK